ncbi:MAG: hypothetical protein EBV06_09700, partial [Planctomycetia bacterium]|nr:hypothetical protein [Planctomycetia bacterium]
MNYQLVAFILAVSSDADPAVKMPTGISPTLVVVQAKGTNLVSEQMVTATKSVPVTEEMVVDGKTVKRTTIKRITEQRKVSNSYSTDGATFQTAGGRKLEKEEALKKLTSPTLVVMSGDGQPVDEGFLAAFKPGTLVV